jgi:AcrR family transcriptional regulator
MSLATSKTKALRADAQRNYDALLAAGKSVFARFGVDAPFEDIAREAGVGRGTLYRHFPTREHLFVAILQERVDFLDAKAREFLNAADAWQALSEWLRLFDQSATEYGGMNARLSSGLADDGSLVGTLCRPMKANFTHLFERARKETPLRADVNAIPLLAMISSLPKDPHSGKTLDPCLEIVLSGLPASARVHRHRANL